MGSDGKPNRRTWVSETLCLPIRVYQKCISPLLPPRCRFYPSCSDYALEAVTRHGPLRGSWLATTRVCRCHPFHPGGVDLVPECTQDPTPDTN